VSRGLNRGEQAATAAAGAGALIALVLWYVDAGNTPVFLASAAALIALAWMVGVSTEQLGASAGPKVGGVLNATFGNAAELIITIFAVRAGQIDVARASITGSILGNTLLVLGLSLLLGGLKNGLQQFDQRIAGMNASMLMLAVIGLGIPTLFNSVGHHGDIHAVSDLTAAIMLLLYGLMLVFYFRSGPSGREAEPGGAAHSHWPRPLSMVVLLGSTAAVAVVADIFVGTLAGVITDLGISAVFLGLIIVPIVGNLAENIVGVKLAYQNEMDFSMVVSLGSSLQIALGVAPLLVFVSQLTAHDFNLVFPGIEIVSLVAASLIMAVIAADGESNWLEGAQLVAVYGIVATAVWYL
jgi:Ca2+:H+ antiporter